MSKQSYFIWNGIDSRAMGIISQGALPIIRPEERVQHIEIPGRSGDLTVTEGEDVYNSYIQTASIAVRGGYRVREIYRWLRGAGYVTFSAEPDRRQKARIIGAITLNRHSRNLDYWEGEVQFYCQPLKEKLIEETMSFTYSGSTIIRNNGDVRCKPLFKIKATSTGFQFNITGDDVPADNVLRVYATTSGSIYWVDCETMEVWNEAKTQLLTKNADGNFPVLGKGVNHFLASTLSDVVITKRERFL